MQNQEFDTFTIQPIGIIHSCFVEKFGTPRQPGLAPSASAVLELVEPFNREEMVRGLERFSHIWIQFVFHQTVAEGWKTTVRPPRLGGKSRLGVFATRSPHRPNHIGLSAVRLLGVYASDNKVSLEIGGADLLDGTPVVDIKPYLPYGDALESATSGWLTEEFAKLPVRFLRQPAEFCRIYERNTGRKLSALIVEILQQDPRPASQRRHRQHFGMTLWEVNIRWEVDDEECIVTACTMTGSCEEGGGSHESGTETGFQGLPNPTIVP